MPMAFDALTKQVAEYSGGMAEDFTLDSIVESALNGEALFDSQEIIENLKSLFLYEVRSALLLGVQILTVCIAIGLLQSLGSSFGKKSLSSVGQLVCTMVIIGIAVSSFRLIYTLSLDTVSTMVNTMALVMPVLLGILIATGIDRLGNDPASDDAGCGDRLRGSDQDDHSAGHCLPRPCSV